MEQKNIIDNCYYVYVYTTSETDNKMKLKSKLNLMNSVLLFILRLDVSLSGQIYF